MRIQVGSGEVPLPGFVNVDIRAVEGVDVVGHAGDLGRFAAGSAELVFGHSFFEHLFVAHQMPALREWTRVLAPGGLLLIMGIPDFTEIARLYVARARGIVGDRFDLFNVYRYTHGVPEIGADNVWKDWSPGAHPDAAPRGWLPQLHKALFDAGYLYELTEACDLESLVFRYCFPGEPYPLSLGLVAASRRRPAAAPPGPGRLGVGGVVEILRGIPTVERFADLGTVALCPRPEQGDLLFDYVRKGSPP